MKKRFIAMAAACALLATQGAAAQSPASASNAEKSAAGGQSSGAAPVANAREQGMTFATKAALGFTLSAVLLIVAANGGGGNGNMSAPAHAR
jgi:hypothetical protein